MSSESQESGSESAKSKERREIALAGEAVAAELDAGALKELQAAGAGGQRLVAGVVQKLGKEKDPNAPAAALKINKDSL